MNGRLTVELADDPPNVDPAVWDDHTAAVRTASRGGRLVKVGRGRSDELSQVDAATGELRLDNADRAYDPASTAIRPWLHCRVRLERDGAVDLDLFRGFIEGIEQDHDEPHDRYAKLRLVDAAKWLAGVDVILTRPAELSGTRIGAVLDAVGWPAGLRALDDGLVELDPVDGEEDKALAWIRTAAEAEDGTFQTRPDGTLDFADRHARLDLTPAATITVDAPLTQAGAWDDELLVNVSRIELADGRVLRHRDQDSIDVYGERTYGDADLPVAPTEAEAAGMWAVFRYADTHERHEPVRFVVTDLTSPLLGLLPGSLLVLQRRWPDGSVDSFDVVLEGLEHDATASRWRLRWNLSPWWGDADWLVVADTEEDDVFGLDEGVAAP